MNIRELLELAAKASGMPVEWEPVHSCFWIKPGNGLPITPWEPHKNRAQALELAAYLGISLTPYPIYNERARRSVVAKLRRSTDLTRQENPSEVIELYRDHQSEADAWSLAIVRCAAETVRPMLPPEEQMLKTIKIKLEAEGYGGLYCAGECACAIDDYLAPCGMAERKDEDEWINGCQPGYKYVDPRRSVDDWVISASKEPPTPEVFDRVLGEVVDKIAGPQNQEAGQ
jgi:hypothetical protein